jgi:hypothetical protein
MPSDHETAVVRGRLGAAIRNGDEDTAADAARELARIRRRRQIEQKERELAELRRRDETSDDSAAAS